MENILTAATIIGAIVLGATQLVKQLVPDNKALPIINVLIGIAIGVIYAATIAKGDLAIYGWAGLIAGLAAGGFYDLGTNSKGLINQSKSGKLQDTSSEPREGE